VLTIRNYSGHTCIKHGAKCTLCRHIYIEENTMSTTDNSLQGITGYLGNAKSLIVTCDHTMLFEICSLQSPGLLPCSRSSFFSSCKVIASLLKQRWENLYKFMCDYCQWQNFLKLLQRTTKQEALINGGAIPEGATRKELLPAS
jgi:hypothetical protein